MWFRSNFIFFFSFFASVFGWWCITSTQKSDKYIHQMETFLFSQNAHITNHTHHNVVQRTAYNTKTKWSNLTITQFYIKPSICVFDIKNYERKKKKCIFHFSRFNSIVWIAKGEIEWNARRTEQNAEKINKKNSNRLNGTMNYNSMA